MHKLFSTSCIFEVYTLWIVILVSSLILFLYNSDEFYMTSVVLAEDESLTLDVSDLINNGNQLSNVGNYTEAIAYFDRAINIQPNNTDALHGKGLALDNFGNHKNAIDIYNKILSIDPYNMDAMASKGVILFNTGNQTEAMNYFQKVLTLKTTPLFGQCLIKVYLPMG